MRSLLLGFLALYLLSCQQKKAKSPPNALAIITATDSVKLKPYTEVKENIVVRRKELSTKYSSSDSSDRELISEEINDYWINKIGDELYAHWRNTPWDFNGTTTKPGEGSIACGYFVTTILRDMDLKINRIKLSICPSSQMMKTLTPNQRLKNLSYLSYTGFNNKIKEYGKGVYIIGLDFHTGFIINDGSETWFIHSNYINRQGVIKETILNSAALQSSKTRWLISLTGDRNFIQTWVKNIAL